MATWLVVITAWVVVVEKGSGIERVDEVVVGVVEIINPVLDQAVVVMVVGDGGKGLGLVGREIQTSIRIMSRALFKLTKVTVEW